MGTDNRTYLKPIGSLQLLAIISVVIGHFAVRDPIFMNSHWVSFCFIYSSFFTAMLHPFGPDYNLRDHTHYMWGKLAKLYPLHLLALALGIFVARYLWGFGISLKALLAQLTFISPWIPDKNYYFAYNPVAWFVCDIFFLYLMAPLVVRLLRRCRLALQVALIITLLVLEYLAGYTPSDGSRKAILGMYILYEFPPIRLLDFALGVVLFNLTQGAWWKRLQSRVTATNATVIELCGVLLTVLLYVAEKSYLFIHCYRACCVVAPSIVVLLATFLLTSKSGGCLSRILCWKPIGAMTAFVSEVYLLQFGVFYTLSPILKKFGLQLYDPRQFILFFVALLIISWLTHRYYVTPAKKWLMSCRDKVLKQ